MPQTQERDARTPSAASRRVPADFFERVRNASARILLLDYDGTLAPFQTDRNRSTPYPEIQPLLQSLFAAAHTRVVIISGRPAQDLLPLLAITPPPEIWGSHGHERLRPNGDYRTGALAREATTALAEAYAAVTAAGLGDYCERKPASLALHWRGLPTDARAQIAELARAQWAPLTEGRHFRLLDFDGGVELCIRGHDKGAAVRTVLAEAPDDAAVAYLGDDTTDEDAFKAIASKGLGVLVRAEYRATAASAWLRPPEELAEFLAAWDRSAARGTPA